MSRTRRRSYLILPLVLATFSCGGEPTASPDTTAVDRDTFVATYVELRTTVLRSPSHELSDEDRTRILSEHGVTEADLVAFAEAHGTDVDFMREVWDDVEARLDAVRLAPPTERR